MSSTENLQKISLVFFVIIGLIHILSGMFVANNYFTNAANTINQALDIPFLIAAIIYLFSSIKIGLLKANKYPEILDSIFLITGILILLGVIAVNLFFPNVKT